MAEERSTASERRFLYDGWNLIAELDPAGAILRKFVWGLDVSGTFEGAGGVGGLLLIEDGANRYYPIYDASHNIIGLYDQTGATVAAYEYDPFGNLTNAAGAYAADNPFRYSTKYTDTETNLIYYGHRYYDPLLGRFLNRDPIAEEGGANLYGFCGNDGVNGWDYLGMEDLFNALFGGRLDEYFRTKDIAATSDTPISPGSGYSDIFGGGGVLRVAGGNGRMNDYLFGAGKDDEVVELEPLVVTAERPRGGGGDSVLSPDGYAQMRRYQTELTMEEIRREQMYPEGDFSAETAVMYLKVFAPDEITTLDSYIKGSHDLWGVVFGYSKADRKRMAKIVDQKNIAAARWRYLCTVYPQLAKLIRAQELGMQMMSFGTAAYTSALMSFRPFAAGSTTFRTWNQFQRGTAGQFASRAEAGQAWSAYKSANGIVTGAPRSIAARSEYLRSLADDWRTPSWQRPFLQDGRVPPGFQIDHIKPLSIGGADAPFNMRLQSTELHRIHHQFYDPWNW